MCRGRSARRHHSCLALFPCVTGSASATCVEHFADHIGQLSGGDCAVVIDGHGGEYVSSGTKFIIEKAKPAKVIIFKEQNVFEKLKKSLID